VKRPVGERLALQARKLVLAIRQWSPTGVRYAWAGFPEATLHNKEGLPARPFRHPATELEVIQKEGQPGKLTARTTTNKSNKSQP
jgi:hypothetical protein